MILPGMTIWPPNFLTPSRRPALSRPLRDEPPAFLCAIARLLRLLPRLGRWPGRPSRPRRHAGRALGVDFGDLQHGLMLTVTVLAPVIVPPLLLEDDDLVGPAMLDERGADRRAVEERRPGRDSGAVTDHQDFAEFDYGTGFAVELLDRDHIVLGDRVLLAAGADHCKHDGTDIGGRACRGKPRPGQRG